MSLPNPPTRSPNRFPFSAQLPFSAGAACRARLEADLGLRGRRRRRRLGAPFMACYVRSKNAPFVAMPGAPIVAPLLRVVRPGAPFVALWLLICWGPLYFGDKEPSHGREGREAGQWEKPARPLESRVVHCFLSINELERVFLMVHRGQLVRGLCPPG